MILQRLAQNLRDRDWVSTWVEVAIVVLGIIIGLQVDDWNEQRKATDRARGYVARLLVDLDIDRAQLDRELAFREAVTAAGQRALTATSGEDPWELTRDAMSASQTGSFRPSDVTYSELRNSGELSLVGTPNIRRKLAVYHSSLNVSAIIEELPAYRESVRGVIPLPIQRYYWQHCHSNSDMGQVFTDCEPPADTSALQNTASTILNSEMLRGQLRYWMSSQFASIKILEERRGLADELSVLLRSLAP
jgi:hypothetical protein